VEPGYEPVQEVFLQHFSDGVEDCAQCCIFVKGDKVVDLWGARTDDAGEPNYNYGPSSMQNIFSSSKVLSSLVVSMLVDRGHLSYTQLVTNIWPEYAQHGKGCTTVGHVMRHEAGLAEFDRPIDLMDLTAERLRSGSIANAIATQRPNHVPGKKRQYHEFTRGWIENEIVRRADPAGRTIGEFLHDEVAVPLGLEGELGIGLPDVMHGAVAPLKAWSTKWALSQLLMPRSLGGGKLPGTEGMAVRTAMVLAIPAMALAIPAARLHKALSASMGPLVVGGKNPAEPQFDLWNTAELRRAEVPSSNGHASARALATIAAVIVEGGALNGRPRLLSPEGVAAAQDDPVSKMLFSVMKTQFTNAGWNLFDSTRMGYVGWMGLGGSVMQWHPEQRIGFGYATNWMEPLPWNARALKMQRLALRCAKKSACRSDLLWLVEQLSERMLTKGRGLL